MPLEVERKYRLQDTVGVRARLDALGVAFGPPERQVDRYFNHPARNFAETDEALRIRSIGERNFVTYKGPKLDRAVKTRRELEPALADGAATADQFAEVLVALGFRPTTSVIKHRASAELARHGVRYQICWDEVDRLGTFLEIELVVEEGADGAARDKVLLLEADLKLTTVEPRSYLSLVLAQEAAARG
jgi:adenylate cyclase class 2